VVIVTDFGDHRNHVTVTIHISTTIWTSNFFFLTTTIEHLSMQRHNKPTNTKGKGVARGERPLDDAMDDNRRSRDRDPSRGERSYRRLRDDRESSAEDNRRRMDVDDPSTYQKNWHVRREQVLHVQPCTICNDYLAHTSTSHVDRSFEDAMRDRADEDSSYWKSKADNDRREIIRLKDLISELRNSLVKTEDDLHYARRTAESLRQEVASHRGDGMRSPTRKKARQESSAHNEVPQPQVSRSGPVTSVPPVAVVPRKEEKAAPAKSKPVTIREARQKKQPPPPTTHVVAEAAELTMPSTVSVVMHSASKEGDVEVQPGLYLNRTTYTPVVDPQPRVAEVYHMYDELDEAEPTLVANGISARQRMDMILNDPPNEATRLAAEATKSMTNPMLDYLEQPMWANATPIAWFPVIPDGAHYAPTDNIVRVGLTACVAKEKVKKTNCFNDLPRTGLSLGSFGVPNSVTKAKRLASAALKNKAWDEVDYLRILLAHARLLPDAWHNEAHRYILANKWTEPKWWKIARRELRAETGPNYSQIPELQTQFLNQPLPSMALPAPSLPPPLGLPVAGPSKGPRGRPPAKLSDPPEVWAYQLLSQPTRRGIIRQNVDPVQINLRTVRGMVFLNRIMPNSSKEVTGDIRIRMRMLAVTLMSHEELYYMLIRKLYLIINPKRTHPVIPNPSANTTVSDMARWFASIGVTLDEIADSSEFAIKYLETSDVETSQSSEKWMKLRDVAAMWRRYYPVRGPSPSLPMWWSISLTTYPSNDDLDGFVAADREFGLTPEPSETHELRPYYDWVLTNDKFPPDFGVLDETMLEPASPLTDLDQDDGVIEAEPLPRVQLASMETRMDTLDYGEEDKDEESTPDALGRPASAPPVLETDELEEDVDME
jgi:hypothetical protein